MTWEVVYLEDVVRVDIPRLDASVRKTIRSAIEDKLARNPVGFGKPLQYSMKGCRRLRVGDCRVVYTIEARRVVVVKIGHRREVYE